MTYDGRDGSPAGVACFACNGSASAALCGFGGPLGPAASPDATGCLQRATYLPTRSRKVRLRYAGFTNFHARTANGDGRDRAPGGDNALWRIAFLAISGCRPRRPSVSACAPPPSCSARPRPAPGRRAGRRPSRCAGSGRRAPDGNAAWPIVPILAGQDAAYLAAQVAAFRKVPPPASIALASWLEAPAPAPPGGRGGRIARPFVTGPAHDATPEDARAAAAWFARQKPLPGRADDPALVDQGKAVFARGDPPAGVIACLDCHGAAGQGLGPFPRVAGQHAACVREQLAAFVADSRSSTSPMHGIARGLTPQEVRAVAAHLQSL